MTQIQGMVTVGEAKAWKLILKPYIIGLGREVEIVIDGQTVTVDGFPITFKEKMAILGPIASLERTIGRIVTDRSIGDFGDY